MCYNFDYNSKGCDVLNNNELLLALSEMMDKNSSVQLEPITNDITNMKSDIWELKADIELLKKVVAEHSEKLQKIS